MHVLFDPVSNASPQFPDRAKARVLGPTNFRSRLSTAANVRITSLRPLNSAQVSFSIGTSGAGDTFDITRKGGISGKSFQLDPE